MKKPVDLSTFSVENVVALAQEHTAMLSRHRQELAPVEARLEAMEKRALDIVRMGKDISGYPRADPFYDKVDVIWIRAKDVKIQATTYVGGGDYVEKFFRFPTTWLSMPDDAWKAELRAACEVTKGKKAAAEARKKQAEAEAQEAYARAIYQGLKARFDP